jgi:PBP1b-binding outer membrane lipoprotein LpoB
MNMNSKITILLVGSSFVFAAGCKSGGKYIETGGTQSVVSVGDVDIQDLQRASSDMLQSMISTGILKRAPHQPARLLINPIINDTSSQFDVGEMTYRMREQLVNSGQAQTITAYGKYTEDEAALEEVRRRSFESGTQPDVEPDYTLSGKITQIRRNAGSTKQVTYTFRLTLTDPNTGLEVWTKTSDVTKQGQKNGIGF